MNFILLYIILIGITRIKENYI